MDTSEEPAPHGADGGGSSLRVPGGEPDEQSGPVRGRLHRPGRLNTLADGVFAIAMTLLALEIRVPESVQTEQEFRDALGPLLGAIAVFVLAFYITAQYWIGQHRMMSYVHTVDATGIRHSVSALVGIAALPVAANLITSWSRFPEAVAVAAGILIVTSLLSMRVYAYLLRPQFADIDPVERRRFLLGPLFNVVIYAVSIPVAFLLPHLGVNSAWAATIWVLLAANRLVARWFAARSAT